MKPLSRPWSATSVLAVMVVLLLTALTLAAMAIFMLWRYWLLAGEAEFDTVLLIAVGVVLLVVILMITGLAVAVRQLLARPLQNLAAAMEAAEYVELSRGGQSIRELQLVAAHYNSMLDGARAPSRTLHREAQRDSLTQLVNRSRMEAELEVELRRAERYGHKFSLILMDVDHFKQINDRHGHLKGDEVLRGLADLMGSRIRSADSVGRWGGEEFLVLCRQTSVQRAERLAEALRASIAEAHPSAGIQCTASFGVTGFNSADSADALFARVDRALQQAKQAGRNRVVIG